MLLTRKENNLSSHLLLTMFFLFFSWLVYSVFYGERILAGNGLGWDGVGYVSFAKNFHELVFNSQLSYYSSQRIFPSFLIYMTAKIFHFPVTETNAPLLFSILNAALLMLCVMIWIKLTKKMKWSLSVQIISFSGLFLNYVNLKMAFYYPTLTDTSALTLGLLMLYFYVEQNKNALLLTTVIGAFTFPTLLYEGLILFLFPMLSKSKRAEKISSTPLTMNILLAIVQSAVLTSLCVFIWYHNDWLGAARAVGGNYSLPVLCLSSLALFLYLTACLSPLSGYYVGILVNFKNISSLKRFMVAMVVFLFVKLIMKGITSPDAVSALTISDYIIHVAGQALAYPFNFIISHVIYYGPIVCLLIFLWKDVVTHLIHTRAFGLFFLLGLYSFLSIGSESRQLINFLPIAVYMVAEVLNQKGVSIRRALVFTLISLLSSKFWFPINHGGEWPSLLTNPPEMTLQFPLQWYFMSQGPWVSQQMFIVNSILVSGLFIAVFMLMKIRRHNILQHNLILNEIRGH